MIIPGQFDMNDRSRNMFGLKPCPDCGSKFTYPTQPVHPTHPNVVLCDDCGWNEPVTENRYAQEWGVSEGEQ